MKIGKLRLLENPIRNRLWLAVSWNYLGCRAGARLYGPRCYLPYILEQP